MKPIMDKTDKILLTLFLMSLAAYLVIFLSAFWDLPLNIPPWHQGLLLYFHSIPMFFLQLLLCRLAKPHWRLFAPLGQVGARCPGHAGRDGLLSGGSRLSSSAQYLLAG